MRSCSVLKLKKFIRKNFQWRTILGKKSKSRGHEAGKGTAATEEKVDSTGK